MTTTTGFATVAPVRFLNADALVAVLHRLRSTRRQALLRTPAQTELHVPAPAQTQRSADARAQAWRSTAGDCSMRCWRSSFGA